MKIIEEKKMTIEGCLKVAESLVDLNPKLGVSHLSLAQRVYSDIEYHPEIEPQINRIFFMYIEKYLLGNK